MSESQFAFVLPTADARTVINWLVELVMPPAKLLPHEP